MFTEKIINEICFLGLQKWKNYGSQVGVFRSLYLSNLKHISKSTCIPNLLKKWISLRKMCIFFHFNCINVWCSRSLNGGIIVTLPSFFTCGAACWGMMGSQDLVIDQIVQKVYTVRWNSSVLPDMCDLKGMPEITCEWTGYIKISTKANQPASWWWHSWCSDSLSPHSGSRTGSPWGTAHHPQSSHTLLGSSPCPWLCPWGNTRSKHEPLALW